MGESCYWQSSFNQVYRQSIPNRNDNPLPVIQFQTDEMWQEFLFTRKNVWLAGFMNYVDRLDFILSTGERPKQVSICTAYVKEIMMPEACKHTRSIEICGDKTCYTRGFKFYDGSNSLIFKVGFTLTDNNVKVMIN